MQAACGARRWLKRYAAGVKLIRSRTEAAASACTILVSCLPALRDVELRLPASLDPDGLSSLLEALACCPRLRALDLVMSDLERGDVPQPLVSCCAPAFAQLRSLTKLALSFGEASPPIWGNVPGCDFADVVDALVPLTSLGGAESAPSSACVCACRVGAAQGVALTAACRPGPLCPWGGLLRPAQLAEPGVLFLQTYSLTSLRMRCF